MVIVDQMARLHFDLFLKANFLKKNTTERPSPVRLLQDAAHKQVYILYVAIDLKYNAKHF